MIFFNYTVIKSYLFSKMIIESRQFVFKINRPSAVLTFVYFWNSALIIDSCSVIRPFRMI